MTIDPGAVRSLLTPRRVSLVRSSTGTRKRSRLPVGSAEDPLSVNHSAHVVLAAAEPALVYLDDPSLSLDHTLLIKSPVNHHLPTEVRGEDEVGHEDQQGHEIEVSHEYQGGPATPPPFLLPDRHDREVQAHWMPAPSTGPLPMEEATPPPLCISVT